MSCSSFNIYLPLLCNTSSSLFILIWMGSNINITYFPSFLCHTILKLHRKLICKYIHTLVGVTLFGSDFNFHVRFLILLLLLPPTLNFSTATFCGKKSSKKRELSYLAAEKAQVSHQSTQHGAGNQDLVSRPKSVFLRAAKTPISRGRAVCCEGRFVSSLRSENLTH